MIANRPDAKDLVGYFMEDPREKRRLVAKVDADEWVMDYLIPQLHNADNILDVGCGPAALVSSAAKLLPHANVTGLEQSVDRLTAADSRLAEQPNAQVVQGNACSMPFNSDQFDFAYTRFMLEYLPQPEQAIQEMVRVVRPGGQVMLQDLDGQLVQHAGMTADLQDRVDQVVRHLAETGFDPFVGRKLFAMAQKAGLHSTEVKAEPYHFYAGPIDPKNLHLWEMKMDIARPMIDKALGGESAGRRFRDEFLAHLQSPDTLTYSTMFTVVGTKLPLNPSDSS